MKRSKAYREASEQIARARLYSPAEAVTMAKANQVTKFDPTVEVALRLGVDDGLSRWPATRHWRADRR